MSMRYFELENDTTVKGRWFLNGLRDSAGRELDPRQFTYGHKLNTTPPLRLSLATSDEIVAIQPPLCTSLRRPGKSLDFTYADFNLPVVTQDVGDLLSSLVGSEIQRFPVTIASYAQSYEILNVVAHVPCIDAEHSEIEWWTAKDHRPDKAGKPRMITKLVIDPIRAANCQILRPDGWEIVIVVGESIKRAFEHKNVRGVKFREV